MNSIRSAKSAVMGRALTRLRRSVIYQPLAVMLSVLLAPSASWMESRANPDSSRAPFQASAQTIIGCHPFQPNAIIQNVCPAGNIGYVEDLWQLEADAVNAYLGLHNLPATDAHLIYDYGRTDLRSEVRASIISILLGIIQKADSARTNHEKNLYSWLRYLVQQNEIAEYTAAIEQYHAWQNNPCRFTLDAQIAAQYGLSYDGIPFCAGSLNSLFGGAPVPAESYFLAYGLKNSYGKAASTYPNFGSLVANTAANVGEVAGIATAAAAVVSSIAGGVLYANTSAALAAYTAAVAAGASGLETTSTALAANSAFILSGATANSVGLVSLTAGPVAIVLIAIAIGVTAGMQAFNSQQTIDDLNNLTNALTNATNTPPDLNAMIRDSSGLGMYKLETTLVSQTVNDVPSTAALPVHRVGTDPGFSISAGAATAVDTETIGYRNWDGVTWSAQTYGGWFVQTCTGGANCTQPDSLMGSIEYVDWSGIKWTASRLGNNFVSTKAAPASTDVPCPADEITGASAVPSSGSFSACASYVSRTIPLIDGSGTQASVSLVVPPPPPVFTSPTTLSFTPGVSSTQTITASGSPTPNICYVSGVLPTGFSLNGGGCGNGSFQVVFNGDSNVPAQTDQLTLKAVSGNGTPVTQTFNVVINLNLTITSPNQFSGTAGFPVDFLITTTGSPIPHLSASPDLLQSLSDDGLSFRDNGNGTASITGTIRLAALVGCFEIPLSGQPTCGVTATNSLGSVIQPVSINASAAPDATLVVPNGATFVAGVSNSVLLLSTGALTPVSWTFNAPANAPFLSLHDNGNGTAVLSGTPPPGSAGTYVVSVTPRALGSLTNNSGSFTLTVLETPIFLSPDIAPLTVGTDEPVQIHTSGGIVSLTGILPQGLVFNGGSSASITGTAAPGTGGQYTVTLVDDAGSAGRASQSLVLNIYEAPKITSATSANFYTGVPGSFPVTTTGYPALSTKPVSQNSMPPTDPTQGQGMHFAVTGLPADLQFSNLNAEGFATGTLTIQGTPSAADAGVHQVQITAENGVGTAATQTLTLNIVAITGQKPTSSNTCNGNYNGTFNGSITVSSGQNCSFVDGGGVTGNVAVQGGHFAVTNGTIGGSVQIQGGAAFSFGPGSKINGNLAIQNVASGSAMNQVCGTHVLGNVEVSYNATSFQLGSASPVSCPGNFIGGNTAIQGNTAPAAVYNNFVQKNLSCSSNVAITGTGDAAASKQGQCASF